MSVIFLLLNIVAFSIVIYLLYRYQGVVLGVFTFCFTILLKIFAGFAIGLLYTHYYSTGDTFRYFEVGAAVADQLYESPYAYFKIMCGQSSDSFSMFYEQPRAIFMAKIVSIVNLFTCNNYWMTSVWFSVFSYFGSITLVRQLLAQWKGQKVAIIFSFLILPSVVFWSAGILKEAISVGALFYLMALIIKYLQAKARFRYYDVLLSVLMLFLLWQTKYYYLAVLILVCLLWLWLKWSERFNLWLRIVTIPLVASVVLVSVSFLHPNFKLDYISEVVTRNYYTFQEISEQGDTFVYNELEPTLVSLIMHSPEACFNGLFRPFFGEFFNGLKLLCSLENTILFFFLMVNVYHLLKNKKHFSALAISILLYVVLLAVFMGLSVPNFGTLSRYKAGYFSFVWLMALWDNPLCNKLNRLVK